MLLLPVKRGANGLNIIEATHVLLVEPLLNPGAEEQAINRVHRIGQKKETIVYRFIIKDTIEERIYEHARKKSVSDQKEEMKKIEQPTVEEIKELFADDFQEVSK